MHSTIQTGLYTPNIFNYEHNFHHPNHNNISLSNSCHHFPPPPSHHHKNKQHQLLYPKQPTRDQIRGSLTQLSTVKPNSSKSSVNGGVANNSKQSKSKNSSKKNGGIQSVNTSLLAIDDQQLPTNNDLKQRNNNKLFITGGGSTLNINNRIKSAHLFSSNYNLNALANNRRAGDLTSSNSISNLSILNTNNNNNNNNNHTYNIIKANSSLNLNNNTDIRDDNKEDCLISNTNNNNLNNSVKFLENESANVSKTNIGISYTVTNMKANQQSNSKSTKNYYKINNRLSRFKSFWECTKPCGVLTCVFGLVLLMLSCFGFYLLFNNEICSNLNMCSNGLLQISSVSNLVIGVVLTLIGIVIVVYSKKDTQVIIATGKHFENLSLVVDNNKNFLHHHHHHHHHNNNNNINNANDSNNYLVNSNNTKNSSSNLNEKSTVNNTSSNSNNTRISQSNLPATITAGGSDLHSTV